MIDKLRGMAFELIALAVVLLAFFLLGRAYLHERDAFTAYRSQAEQRETDAREELRQRKEDETRNLAEVRKNYEDQISAAGHVAVANFCLRNPTLCRAPAKGPATCNQVDDGAERERVPVSPDPAIEALVERAGRDVLKLRAWREYCMWNNCPIVD